VFWDKVGRFRFWDQKVKGQGHDGIKYRLLETALCWRVYTVLDVWCLVEFITYIYFTALCCKINAVYARWLDNSNTISKNIYNSPVQIPIKRVTQTH